MLLFSAVLVYETPDGRRAIECPMFAASHPEIAYRKAMRQGAEPRYGWRFAGIAELAVADESQEAGLGLIESGSAQALVVTKSDLSAFRDSRWAGVEPDAAELAAAEVDPPALMELTGVEEVPWATLSHAYGPATDVPLDLRRLASSDANLRQAAVDALSGTIYHQGDLFTATAAAIPFLMRIAACPAIPDRAQLLEFLLEIAERSVIDPEWIRKERQKLRKLYGDCYVGPADEMPAEQIAANAAVHAALLAAEPELRQMQADPDTGIRELALRVADVIRATRARG